MGICPYIFNDCVESIMRIIQYGANQFNIEDAMALCIELEASLGVVLHVANPALPSPIQGHFNTDSEGNIEVYLYDAEDCDAIEAMPAEVRFAKCGDCGCEQNDWTDPDICENCGSDIDYSKGRIQLLKAHSGIYKATKKTDSQILAACDNVLVSKYKMERTDLSSLKSHAVEACERAETKMERKAIALALRA